MLKKDLDTADIVRDGLFIIETCELRGGDRAVLLVDSCPFHEAGLHLKKQQGGPGATSTGQIQFLEANHADC